ncbi:MAG: replication protein [Armatimonadetes bacterium]|nr:replication protein [Armatimonadota bacterium]
MANCPPQEEYRFPGFRSPHYTQVPDEAFDELMARLTPAEFKVMMYIIRRTFGFKKNSDAISLSQLVSGLRTRDGRVLDHGTGLSKSGVVKAIKGLLRKNVIRAVRRPTGPHTYEATLYALNLADNSDPSPATPSDAPLVDSVDSPSTLSAQAPVSSEDSASALSGHRPVHSEATQESQEKETQSTEQQISDAVAFYHIQTPEKSLRGPAPTTTATSTSPASDLISSLTNLGVTKSVAERLCATYPAARIVSILDHVHARIERGEGPREPAAWVVAALREHYTLGTRDDARTTGPSREGHSIATPDVSPAPLTDPAEDTLRQMQAELALDPQTQHLWQEVIDQLRTAGLWNAAISACQLRREDTKRFVLLVPHPSLAPAVDDLLARIAEILTGLVGEDETVDIRIERWTVKPGER